jgi:hypothetical protein
MPRDSEEGRKCILTTAVPLRGSLGVYCLQSAGAAKVLRKLLTRAYYWHYPFGGDQTETRRVPKTQPPDLMLLPPHSTVGAANVVMASISLHKATRRSRHRLIRLDLIAEGF